MRKEICTLINWDEHSKCERSSYTGQKLPTNWHFRGKTSKRLEQPGVAQHRQSPGGDRDSEGQHPSPEPTEVRQQLGNTNQVLMCGYAGRGRLRGVWRKPATMHAESLCVLFQKYTCAQTSTRGRVCVNNALRPWSLARAWGQDGVERTSESAIFCSASKLCYRKGPLGWGRTHRSTETLI